MSGCKNEAAFAVAAHPRRAGAEIFRTRREPPAGLPRFPRAADAKNDSAPIGPSGLRSH